MSVRPFLTESSTLRTVVIIPPSGPNALTASSVEWFSEMALHVICESEILSENKNELDHEAKLSVRGLFDVFHDLLLVVIVDHDVRPQALDILVVRRTRSGDHFVARKVQHLNGIRTNGARTTPNKYRYFTIGRKRERASIRWDWHLQVAEDSPDSGAKGEWNRRCFFISQVFWNLVSLSASKLIS